MPTTPNQLAVCVRGLRKAYSDVVAVDHLDLEVGAGECFGLLGSQRRGEDNHYRDLRRPSVAR